MMAPPAEDEYSVRGWQPWVSFAGIALVLNLVWELAQSPLYLHGTPSRWLAAGECAVASAMPSSRSPPMAARPLSRGVGSGSFDSVHRLSSYTWSLVRRECGPRRVERRCAPPLVVSSIDAADRRYWPDANPPVGRGAISGAGTHPSLVGKTGAGPQASAWRRYPLIERSDANYERGCAR